MLKEKLENLFDEMSTSELLSVHCEYCDSVNAFDDYIYSMDEFDEIMSGYDAFHIACRVFYGDFNPGTAEYFKFNGYGNLVSMYEYEVKNNIYIDDIIDYIIENDDSLYNDDVQNILDELSVEDEDE